MCDVYHPWEGCKRTIPCMCFHPKHDVNNMFICIFFGMNPKDTTNNNIYSITNLPGNWNIVPIFEAIDTCLTKLIMLLSI